MNDMTVQEHVLKVAVLEALTEAAKAEYARARGDAEDAFKRHCAADGNPRQAVTLPDGMKIGQLTIKAAVTDVDVTEDALMAWTREHNPDGIEEYVVPGTWTNTEVIAMVKACFPGTVRERMRPATGEALRQELIKAGGKITDEETGETLTGEVKEHDPNGSFSFAGASSKPRRAAIMRAWRAGELNEVGLGALAIGAAADDSEMPERPAPAMNPMFGDEHGFRDPEAAAAHAIVVQGGFSTPPVEAYRMIRDGGVGAERARAWLAEHDLDPEDPRRGQDTPWPVPATEENGSE
jgi:hypothetical protein